MRVRVRVLVKRRAVTHMNRLHRSGRVRIPVHRRRDPDRIHAVMDQILVLRKVKMWKLKSDWDFVALTCLYKRLYRLIKIKVLKGSRTKANQSCEKRFN